MAWCVWLTWCDGDVQGNELVTELQVKRGPAIKQTLDRILAWQLRHPHKTRADCIAHFRASAGE